MKTVVGLYKTVAEANKVKLALAGEGFSNEHVTVIDQTGGDYNTGTSYTGHSRDSNVDTSTVGGKIKHFFSGLAGTDDDDNTSNAYSQSVGSGGALLAVTVPDEKAESTAELLSQHGATGIEGDSYGSGSRGSSSTEYGTGAGAMGTGSLGAGSNFTGGSRGTGADDVAVLEGNTGANYRGTSATGDQVIPIVEEDLVVGKREVTRGGVRIYSHVTERPVSENVTLRDERIVVDRRPVDRAATEADFNPNAGVIELTATGEEAVVGKRSRVVEEVLVGKESSEHTEQINDTVRRTDVEVEQTGTRTGTTGTTGTTGLKDDFASTSTETKQRY